ncbi:MAG: hypothetical protein K6T65_01595 [Peptococcaceae bacterium]|nr:hypothetical protein [Peptococcaceae bacterium]
MVITETIPGTDKQIEIYSYTRRYPGIVFRWGKWRFVCEDDRCWRDLGDPFSGKGALQEIRDTAKAEAFCTLEKPQFYATADLIGREVVVDGVKCKITTIGTSVSVGAIGKDGLLRALRISQICKNKVIDL